MRMKQQQPNLFEQLMQVKLQKAQLDAMQQEGLRNRVMMEQAQQRFPVELAALRSGVTNADRSFELQRAQEERAAQEANMMNPLKARMMQWQLDNMPKEQSSDMMRSMAMLMQGMGAANMDPVDIRGVASRVMPDYMQRPGMNEYMAADPRLAKWIQLTQEGKIK